MEEKRKPGRPRKPFPLPPRPKNGVGETVKKIGAAASSSVKSVAQAPGKLMERVNQELYKRNAELAVRNKTLALLRKLDEISLATVAMEDLAEQITAAIATELGYDVVSIAVVKEDTQTLQWLGLSSSIPWVSDVIEKIDLKELHVPITNGLASVTVLKSEKFEYVDDPKMVYPAEFMNVLAAADQSPDIDEVRYSILYPLRFGKKMLGLLTLSSSRSLKDLSKYEQESVTGIIGLVALALYKADIYEDLQETTGKLEEANKQLTELDKAKSEFLSIASHQLYTPLTALRGYISMMLEGDFGAVPEKQGPVLDILNTSAEKLIGLIKNLLDISRIESGRLELDLKSVDLAKMTDDLVQTLYPNAVAKGLKLAFHHPPATTPHVVADEQRLRQVMLNFIDNSIKYTPKGKIDVRIETRGEEVTFSVTDTGKGLAPDEITKLFHKFSRVGGASRFHTEGTGLGLYVAKQIVGEHRGEVEVTSPGVGKGSTFAMHLPIEGAPKSLKIGEKASVVIKAADANGQGQPGDKSPEKPRETKK